MFHIIQSNQTERLVDQLLLAYQSPQQSIFEPFVVIVPSMVLGDWLQKRLATKAGISTLITTTFWGQYQWKMIQSVLDIYNETVSIEQQIRVPEVAVLSTTVMQWRIFGYVKKYYSEILSQPEHPLYPLLSSVLELSAENKHSIAQKEHRLWQLSVDMARIFNRYLTHRNAWLVHWSNNQPIDVEALIQEKDRLQQTFNENALLTPDWLIERYVELEMAQRHLWYVLFRNVFQYRQELEHRFWQVLQQQFQDLDLSSVLPKQLYLFTIQQLPQHELNFIYRLSQYIDITLYYYNPSLLFWADIVDDKWLQRQKIINPEYLVSQDSGHPLLSRLGKQSREIFAMLADLSGNESFGGYQVEWQDDFVEYPENTLLTQLQQDILMLNPNETKRVISQKVSYLLRQYMTNLSLDGIDNDNENTQLLYGDDNSLSIHSCHNLQRQLEILRTMIGIWLNQPDTKNQKRHLSDIVVLLPDVERYHQLIASIFLEGKGEDGLILPARITGIMDTEVRQLWQAISGFYRLLSSEHSRFVAEEVYDWLMLPPLYESFGLTHEQMIRGCELLRQAGFIRGFDEQHLKQSVAHGDKDYRFTFSYALDRLVFGFIMPQVKTSDCLYAHHKNVERTVPLASIQLSDAHIIEALCRIHAGLSIHRNDHDRLLDANTWLNRIENQIIDIYFAHQHASNAMRAIFKVMNGFKSNLRANGHYQKYENLPNDISLIKEQADYQIDKMSLKLNFLLDSIENQLANQQVSAEPTGVITFGRFGGLRNVPFKLVVMLNMNLSEFPQQDKHHYYDLMKAGLPKRGDRSAEDDNNGAFLDAIMCAQEACWIFYNGQSLTDGQEHLPANPVSELIQFLQSEVVEEWQELNQIESTGGEDISSNDNLVEQIKHYLPRLIEDWLITKHSALPFSQQNFIKSSTKLDMQDGIENGWQNNLLTIMQHIKQNQKSKLPPAKIWQQVFFTLQQQHDFKNSLSKNIKLKLPTKKDYKFLKNKLTQHSTTLKTSNLSNEIKDMLNHEKIQHNLNIDYLIQDIKHPAKTFLKKQNIYMQKISQLDTRQEPLVLSHLDKYQLSEKFIHTDINNQSVLDEIFFISNLPASVARKSSFQENKDKISNTLDKFEKWLTNHYQRPQDIINKFKYIHEQEAQVTIDSLVIKGQVPSEDLLKITHQKWLNIKPNKAKVTHILAFWISHLFWQIQRKTRFMSNNCLIENAGQSIWLFNHDNNLSKILGKEVKDTQQVALIFPAIEYEEALSYLKMWIQFDTWLEYFPIIFPLEHAFMYVKAYENKNCPPAISFQDVKSWLFYDAYRDYISEDCSHHETWQFILENAYHHKEDKQSMTEFRYHALLDAIGELAVPLLQPIKRYLTVENI